MISQCCLCHLVYIPSQVTVYDLSSGIISLDLLQSDGGLFFFSISFVNRVTVTVAHESLITGIFQ